MIKLKDIWVVFNRGSPLEQPALRGIDLQISEGEFVVIIGGNGAGKSTLMNVLSGNIDVDQGTILIDKENVTKLKAENRAPYVSRVFQNPMLGTCGNLSIEENLALACSRGYSRGLKSALTPSIRDTFRESLKRLGIGLEDRMADPMSLLSGGQRQAVSLLMATMQPSKILLLDEHTAALDPKMAKKVLALTKQLIAEHNLTTLMITHSLHQALELGERTIVMNHGKIEKEFTLQDRKSMTPVDLMALFEE